MKYEYGLIWENYNNSFYPHNTCLAVSTDITRKIKYLYQNALALWKNLKLIFWLNCLMENVTSKTFKIVATPTSVTQLFRTLVSCTTTLFELWGFEKERAGPGTFLHRGYLLFERGLACSLPGDWPTVRNVANAEILSTPMFSKDLESHPPLYDTACFIW